MTEARLAYSGLGASHVDTRKEKQAVHHPPTLHREHPAITPNPTIYCRRAVLVIIVAISLELVGPFTPCRAQTLAADGPSTGQAVRLYYFREATKIVAILTAVANQKDAESELKGLIAANPSEDEIVLYGSTKEREYARRIIAALDLPRPGVEMEMWGIQISSRKPERMAEVVPKIHDQIDRTQEAVRETYNRLQQLTREVIPDSALDSEFRILLTEKLFYRSALDANRPLSVPDILVRMIAAKDPSTAASAIASGLDSWLRNSEYRDYLENATNGAMPFERFFKTRGLTYRNGNFVENSVTQNALSGRIVLLQFALHYGRLVHEPARFSPYSLQQSAEILNRRVQDATEALNLDMQDLFVKPTLARIQGIVGQFRDVEYAQVGSTTVASLSGTPTVVTSHSVNAFDVTPPLRLSELLAKADALSKSAGTFVPKPAENLVGAMPLAQVIGLLGALGEERSVWRELQTGVSINITPNVLRDMASAELEIDLKTGDPQAGTREQGVRPLSRVSQHDVKTKVYVNALDFFDLSTFFSQSTLGGGRGYVPIIGPVWQGIFGEVPVAGKLFSWKKNPQTVFSQSLILINSFITPTVMGIAVLYPTELVDPETGKIEYDFGTQLRAVNEYEGTMRSRLNMMPSH